MIRERTGRAPDAKVGAGPLRLHEQLTTDNQQLATNLLALRAPRERQTPASGLYSGAMIMPSPYRPARAPRRGPGSDVMDREGGFGAEIFFNREILASRRYPPP